MAELAMPAPGIEPRSSCMRGGGLDHSALLRGVPADAGVRKPFCTQRTVAKVRASLVR